MTNTKEKTTLHLIVGGELAEFEKETIQKFEQLIQDGVTTNTSRLKELMERNLVITIFNNDKACKEINTILFDKGRITDIQPDTLVNDFYEQIIYDQSTNDDIDDLLIIIKDTFANL